MQAQGHFSQSLCFQFLGPRRRSTLVHEGARRCALFACSGVSALHPGKLLVECTALDSQNLGRFGLVAFRLLQDSLDMLALNSVKSGGLVLCLASFQFSPDYFLRDGSGRLHCH